MTLSFDVDEQTAAGPIVLEELGVFERREGLLNDTRRFFPAIPPARYTTLAQRGVAALCMFTVIAAVFLPPGSLKRYAASGSLDRVLFAVPSRSDDSVFAICRP